MKSLRFLSTLGVLAICTVFASAQDSGIGRGHRDKDSGSKSRNDSPPTTSPGRSSPPPDQGRTRDRSSDPSRSAPPTQDPGRSRDRSSDPSRSAPPTQDPGRSRDRSSDPSRSAPPTQDPGRSRDRSSDPSRSAPPTQDPGRSRDRSSDPSRSAPPTQDGGLGRGSSGSQSGGNGPTRDRNSDPGRSNPPQDSGRTRDRNSDPNRGGVPTQDGGLGRSGGSGTQRDQGTTRSGGAGTQRDQGTTRSGGSGIPRDSGTGRDQGSTRSGGAGIPRDSGTGRDQGLGRTRNDSMPTQGRVSDQPSRSGSVNYRGNNNVDGRIGTRTAIIPPTTYGIIKSTSIEQRARREDASRHPVGLFNNGWRTGYCHYNNNWNDSYFWYPNYCFSPFGNVNIVISPWYSYTFLPGYLNCEHVYVNNYRGYWGWNTGFVYNYYNDNYGFDYQNSVNRELNYSIEDLQNGFEDRDYRALDRLVPDRGQIAIYRDGRYDYSIDTRDFADLLNDLSSNANTNRYRILETRVNRNSARISALHEYTDQWGNRQRVYHSIYLENERGNMVIREFGTSNSRVW